MVCCTRPKPAAFMMVEIMPCTILNNAIINSNPYVTAPFARANRMNNFMACSGFLTCAKSPQVRITPTTKNRTSRASPIACNALLMSSITLHIVPPLNCSGDWVINCHISSSFSFHVVREFSKFCTTQLSDIVSPPNFFSAYGADTFFLLHRHFSFF